MTLKMRNKKYPDELQKAEMYASNFTKLPLMHFNPIVADSQT